MLQGQWRSIFHSDHPPRVVGGGQNSPTIQGQYSRVVDTDYIAELHDRMPLLIPVGFACEWLVSKDDARSLMEAAIAASRRLSETVVAHPSNRH